MTLMRVSVVLRFLVKERAKSKLHWAFGLNLSLLKNSGVNLNLKKKNAVSKKLSIVRGFKGPKSSFIKYTYKTMVVTLTLALKGLYSNSVAKLLFNTLITVNSIKTTLTRPRFLAKP